MNNDFLTGSICLSDIPRELMKKVRCRDGRERIYLNIAVFPKREAQTYTDGGVSRTYTHFVSCAPKKDARVDGVNYILGNLETRGSQPVTPTSDAVASAPSISCDEVPF